ncbi:Gfo/Idh/MocA family oxidoreductase [Anaerocolumna sp. AGMB13020]|uniref:Gfo/Idh/MocA family protein n=1 Tax=Anaerocolumna sp. AGMB13020 TaxID=3081750 RepID=UPI002954528C|nr:Gfo/Idh/MocA family oxidoreductase [Anaerocolumna sp. AGMB13020]WOO38634.1 Gfo/Idh/MocA family oxidoreductase [Anaerocolumna sp. AGMB13020]
MNIAVVSYWHVHAEGYTKEVLEKTDSKIVAVWDEEEERGRKYAEEFSVPFIKDYEELLHNSNIQGVIITAPTSMHKELIIKAIKQGKKVFSEKVLALTLSDCLEIKEALLASGKDITLSLVKKCESTFLFAKELVESGSLGRITYARMRNVHNGSTGNWLPEHFYNKEQCGGGAMIDLGAHPMYLLTWLLGTPLTVQSVFTDITGHGVEDNAVSVIEFEGEAIGVAETGFVSVYTPPILEISGTDGTLIVGETIRYATKETEGRWITPDKLPPALPSPLVMWARDQGEEMEAFGIEASITLTKLMEAAYESHTTGKKAVIATGSFQTHPGSSIAD